MKNFLLLTIFSVLLIISSKAQYVILFDDFEGNGIIDTWFGDACGINTEFANPYQQEINTSPTVLQYNDYGGQYANVRFDVNENFDVSSFYIFSIKIYVPANGITGSQPNQVSLKLQDGTLNEPWVTQSEIIKPIELDQWQTVEFNFKDDPYINLDPNSPPPTQRTDFNRLLIQVNGENNTDHVIAYIDDVSVSEDDTTGSSNFNLVWSDEFNTNGSINSEKWWHQTQLPLGGNWYNGEIQHYTNRTDNSYVQDGMLNIVAKKETFTDQGITKEYTSSRLNTKFAFTYGKVEVRAKLPTGAGTWPAIWMLGKNIDEDGAWWDNLGYGTTAWPACGEIDIMEHWGTNQNYVQSATHTPSSFGATINHGGQVIPTASSNFHVYALEWTPEKLTFSVDDVVHYVYQPETYDSNTWPFDAEQYLLLNVAILPDISPSFTESSMLVDYVRVYQESPSLVSTLQETNIFHLYPNPFHDIFQIQSTETFPIDQVRIFDINGRLLYTQSPSVNSNNYTINNLHQLQKGMYIIELISGNKCKVLKGVKN